MTDLTKGNILDIYDEAINKNKAINDISKLFGFPRDEIKDVLAENGRALPYQKKPKSPEVTEEVVSPDQEAEDEPDKAADRLPIPNYVFDVLIKELDALDMQINAMSQKLAELSTKYTDISKFIKEYKRP